MTQFIHKSWVRQEGFVVILLLLLLLAGMGCGKEEAPLKGGALELKKEVKKTLQKLAPLILDPVLKRDEKAAEAALEKFVSETLQKSRAYPTAIGILIKDGTVMVRWSRTGFHINAENYIQYKIVSETLKNRKTNQQRLFLQGGERVYMICAPILREKNVEGAVGLGFSASELKEQLGLSEEEFLAIDFN